MSKADFKQPITVDVESIMAANISFGWRQSTVGFGTSHQQTRRRNNGLHE